MPRIPVLLSEALLVHDVYVCLERPSGALPPEVITRLTSRGLSREAPQDSPRDTVRPLDAHPKLIPLSLWTKTRGKLSGGGTRIPALTEFFTEMVVTF